MPSLKSTREDQVQTRARTRQMALQRRSQEARAEAASAEAPQAWGGQEADGTVDPAFSTPPTDPLAAASGHLPAPDTEEPEDGSKTLRTSSLSPEEKEEMRATILQIFGLETARGEPVVDLINLLQKMAPVATPRDRTMTQEGTEGVRAIPSCPETFSATGSARAESRQPPQLNFARKNMAPGQREIQTDRLEMAPPIPTLLPYSLPGQAGPNTTVTHLAAAGAAVTGGLGPPSSPTATHYTRSPSGEETGITNLAVPTTAVIQSGLPTWRLAPLAAAAPLDPAAPSMPPVQAAQALAQATVPVTAARQTQGPISPTDAEIKNAIRTLTAVLEARSQPPSSLPTRAALPDGSPTIAAPYSPVPAIPASSASSSAFPGLPGSSTAGAGAAGAGPRPTLGARPESSFPGEVQREMSYAHAQIGSSTPPTGGGSDFHIRKPSVSNRLYLFRTVSFLTFSTQDSSLSLFQCRQTPAFYRLILKNCQPLEGTF